MKWRLFVIAAAVVWSAVASGMPQASAREGAHATAQVQHAWARPAPPLPMLPSLGRVRVEAARDHVTVIEDIHLPHGDWQSGGLDLYVAFGSPGTPIAVDARLLAAAPGATELRAEDAGDALTVEPAVHHSPSTQLLLGPPHMAGVVVHVRDADLRRAYAAGDFAGVRLRSLLGAPAADASGGRTVVVRLGIAGGLPIALERLQVVSLEAPPWMRGAEASLCGPEAETRPLALSVSPRPVAPQPVTAPADPPIAPAMAVRHASDDLCIRWWAGA
jgi:hypothetical protein